MLYPLLVLPYPLTSIAGKVNKNEEYVLEIRRERILCEMLAGMIFLQQSVSRLCKVFRVLVSTMILSRQFSLESKVKMAEDLERKMWRLFALALKGSYFEGNEGSMVVRHDTMALQVSVENEIDSC